MIALTTTQRIHLGLNQWRRVVHQSTAVMKAKYDVYDSMPLDQLIFGMRYWRKFCDLLIAQQMRKIADERKYQDSITRSATR